MNDIDSEHIHRFLCIPLTTTRNFNGSNLGGSPELSNLCWAVYLDYMSSKPLKANVSIIYEVFSLLATRWGLSSLYRVTLMAIRHVDLISPIQEKYRFQQKWSKNFKTVESPEQVIWKYNIRNTGLIIGIDTNIEVLVVSLTTWEAHHSPRARPEGCGELPRSLMRQKWPKLRYQFLFYHDDTKLMMNKQILSIWMLKFFPKLSLVTAWLHVHILGSCDLIVSPW